MWDIFQEKEKFAKPEVFVTLTSLLRNLSRKKKKIYSLWKQNGGGDDNSDKEPWLVAHLIA